LEYVIAASCFFISVQWQCLFFLAKAMVVKQTNPVTKREGNDSTITAASFHHIGQILAVQAILAQSDAQKQEIQPTRRWQTVKDKRLGRKQVLQV
jgi:hypothetical protein